MTGQLRSKIALVTLLEQMDVIGLSFHKVTTKAMLLGQDIDPSWIRLSSTDTGWYPSYTTYLIISKRGK